MPDPKEMAHFHSEVKDLMKGADPDAQFKDKLRAQLLYPAANLPRRRRLVLHPVWIVLVALVVFLFLTTLIVGPQKVLASVQDWLGYVPGVGFVSKEAPLRILAEPVTFQRDGVTVEVQQVFVDSKQTVLVYRIGGFPLDTIKSMGENLLTGSINEIHLPNGKVLAKRDGLREDWGTGYLWHFYYPPIPQNIDQFSLIIPILDDFSQGAESNYWQIPIKLKPAGEEIVVLPVQETFPTATFTYDETSTTITPEVLQLKLNRSVELDDGYLLQGVYSWDMLEFPNLNVILSDLEVIASDNTRLATTYPLNAQNIDNAYNEQLWTIKVLNKSAPFPWTIHLSRAYTDYRCYLPFTLDFGKAPHSGQKWNIDQTFSVYGHVLQVKTAALEAMDDGSYNLIFYLRGDEGLLSASVTDPRHPEEIIGSGTNAGTGGQAGNLVAFVYYTSLPTGKVQFAINSVNLELVGDWNILWIPSEVANGENK